MQNTLWLLAVCACLAVEAQYGPPPTKGKKHRTTTTTTEVPGSYSNDIAGPFPLPEASLPGSTAVTGGDFWWQGPESPFKPGAQPQPGSPSQPRPPPPSTGGCGGPAGCTGLGTDPRPSPPQPVDKPVDIAQNPFLSSAILGKPLPQSPQGCQGAGGCQYPATGPQPTVYPGTPADNPYYKPQKPAEYPGQPSGSSPYPGQAPGPSQYPGAPSPQNPQACQGCQYQGSGPTPANRPGGPANTPFKPQKPTGYPSQPSGSSPFPGQAPGPNQYPGTPGNKPGPFPPQYPNKPASPGQGPSQYPGQGPSQFPGQGPSQFPGQGPSQFPGQGPNQFPGQGPSQFPGQGPSSVPLRPQCAASDHACVPSSMCVGGVISANGISQMRDSQIKECIPGLEACCRIPPGAGPVTPAPGYRPVSQQPYTGPLNTTPHPGCAAALKCVAETYCTADGVMSDTPVILTREQSDNKVPLSDCQDPDTGVIGKCCRDPNYKDPWPAGMMMMKNPQDYDDGQYHGEGSGPGPAVNVGPSYNSISSTPGPHTPGKDHGPKPVPQPGGFNKPFPPPFPGQKQPVQSSGTPYQPGQPSGTPYQPGQPSGTPYQPGQPSGTPYQPGQPSGTPYQPGQPSGTPYQPGQPSGTPYQPGQPSGTPYQPGQTSGTPYQPGQPSGTPYQPGQSAGTPYQPSQPSGTTNQPGQPSGTPYQPGQTSGTPYQSGQPSGTPYQPSQPSGTPYQPGQPSGTPYQPPTPGSPYQPSQPQQPSSSPDQAPQPAIFPDQPAQETGPTYQPSQPTGTPYQPGKPTPAQQPDYNLPTHPGQNQPSLDQGPAPGSSCGIRRPGPPGDVAGFAEFPWQALVVSAGNRSLLCGAAIISENAVITAAHCVNQLRAGDLLVKAGEWKLLGQNPKPVQVRPVVTVARHPGYDRGSLAKDLAVLVVAEPFTLDQHVDKICIPPALGSEYFQKPGQQCLITGWGKNALSGPIQDSELHKIEVNVIPAKQCEAKLKTSQNLGKYFILNEGFSCALPPSPLDLCKVDFGSAVACAREDGHYELAGVNSWDIACPTNQPLPSVFATSDAQWIETILSTPLPVLQAQEQTYLQSLLQGESVDGADVEDKPGFSQGYGK